MSRFETGKRGYVVLTPDLGEQSFLNPVGFVEVRHGGPDEAAREALKVFPDKIGTDTFGLLFKPGGMGNGDGVSLWRVVPPIPAEPIIERVEI